MNKPLHPFGTHRLKLINVNMTKFGPLMVQCIFEGTGENKHCYTISRLISKHGKWGDSSWPFLEQLKGYDSEKGLYEEISRFIRQEFICVIPRQGKGRQMNISRFLEMPNINSTTLSTGVTLPGELHELG